jgi:hypothetical protein
MEFKMATKFKFIIRNRITGEYSFANRKPKSESKYSSDYDKYSTTLLFGSMLGYSNVKSEYTHSEMTFLMLKLFKQNLRNLKRELKEVLALDPSQIQNQTSVNYYISVRERMIKENTELVKIWTKKAKEVKSSNAYLIELLTK